MADESKAPENTRAEEAGPVAPVNAAQPDTTAQSRSPLTVEGQTFEDTQIAESITNNFTLDVGGALALLAGNTEGELGAQARSYRHMARTLLGLFLQPQSGNKKDGVEADTGQTTGQGAIPATEVELYAWFRRLSAMERCQVRATAILHGAPTHVISAATGELYAACFPNAKTDAKDEGVDPDALHIGDTILEHALTTVRFVSGAQRLYWKDVDSDGQSEFGIRALNLVADEISGIAGVRTENALPVIERWVASGRAEVSQRAAYAQGVIWRRLDHQRLNATVRGWARSPNESHRVCSPVMALGAFAAEHVERAERRQRADQLAAEAPYGAHPPAAHGDRRTGIGEREEHYATLRMLARMGRDAQGPAQRGVDRGLFAIAVGAAYNLIGLEWTDHALDGLDRLLGLARAFDDEAPQVIPGYVCLPAALAYAELAAAGHLRDALARLGVHARMLGRKPRQIPASAADRERDSRRKDRLFNTSLAFALVVAASSPLSKRSWTRYGANDRLEESPEFDTHQREGRDTLLDGLLSAGETELQFDTQSLLWACMTGDTAELAEQALLLWVNRVAQVTIDAPNSTASETFVRFLVALDVFAAQRDPLGHYDGFGAPRARYRRWLSNWSKVVTLDEKKRRVSAIARDALAAMPAM